MSHSHPPQYQPSFDQCSSSAVAVAPLPIHQVRIINDTLLSAAGELLLPADPVNHDAPVCHVHRQKDEIATGETSAEGLDEDDADGHASGDAETKATRGDVQKTSRALEDDSPRTRYDFRVRHIVTSKEGVGAVDRGEIEGECVYDGRETRKNGLISPECWCMSVTW